MSGASLYLAKAGNRDKSSLGHLVADLRDLLASPRIMEFNKIYRDQNSTNYELARFGMLPDRTGVGLETAHEPLLSAYPSGL
jgi:hypothetical protein